MKAVIAYALVIVGVTQLVGMLVGSAISLPIAMLVPHSLKLRLLPLLEFFHGAAALAAALLLFWLLGVSITALLPIIVGAWLTFYFFSYGQSKVAWWATVLGVLACWVVYRFTFAP
jgi:hypothetical protein